MDVGFFDRMGSREKSKLNSGVVKLLAAMRIFFAISPFVFQAKWPPRLLVATF